MRLLHLCFRQPYSITRGGFYPQFHPSHASFSEKLSRDSIQTKVEQRVAAYEGTKEQWYIEWFEPALQQIKLGLLQWEAVIAKIEEHDVAAGTAIREFYGLCLRLNS